MYEAVCNLNYFEVMKRAIRFISIEPLNLKKKVWKYIWIWKLATVHFFFSTENDGLKCQYEGDILTPSTCETCRCVNGSYECTFIENCDEDSSKSM